jgi:predicted nucleic acid-binding protein
VSEPLLIDTGTLVALLRRGDGCHELCVEHVRLHDVRLVTCWPVVTEAAWLLRIRPEHVQSLLRFFSEGLIELAELGPDAPRWISSFLDRYGEHEPQLADVSLLYLAARRGIRTIFTLDRKEVTAYRFPGDRHLRIVPERG